MKYRYSQKFHAVGQGLFYYSFITNNWVTLDVVFDCGSDNIDFIVGEVDEYKKVSKIDLLIISHLHYDHVYGLDNLFENITMDTVALLYLFPEKRFLLQFINGTKSALYSQFLENPDEWLEKNNIKKLNINYRFTLIMEMYGSQICILNF